MASLRVLLRGEAGGEEDDCWTDSVVAGQKAMKTCCHRPVLLVRLTDTHGTE